MATVVVAAVAAIVAVVAVVAVIVAAVVVIVAWATVTVPHIGRRHAAKPADVPARHPATRVVVGRALALARDEALAAGPIGSPILKDEARLGTGGPHEHDAAAAIGAVWIVPGIIVHEHAEAHARVEVGIPVGITDVGVAVVAQETRIVVVLADIVRDDVVVPINIPVRFDTL